METGNATEQERDQQTLLLQIESLQAQLEEQTKLSREEIDALQEDRRVRNEEYSASTERDQDKVKSLTEKLHKTQDLLYQSTKDFLELKYELRERERQWMMDRDRLVQEIEHFRKQVDVSGSSVLEATGMSVEPQVRSGICYSLAGTPPPQKFENLPGQVVDIPSSYISSCTIMGLNH